MFRFGASAARAGRTGRRAPAGRSGSALGLRGEPLEERSMLSVSASMVANISARSENYTSPTMFRGELYYSAYDLVHGYELWKFDGKSSSLVADIEPGLDSSFVRGLYVFHDTLFFEALGELWKYDGTSARQVANILPGYDHSAPNGGYRFAEFNDKLYFFAKDDTYKPFALYTTDGVGVSKIGSSVWDVAYPNFGSPTAYQGKLYFLANAELHAYDGVEISAIGVSDPSQPLPTGSQLMDLAVYQDRLYMASELGLYAFDGSDAVNVANFPPQDGYRRVQELIVVGEELLMTRTDDSSSALWRYDGEQLTRLDVSPPLLDDYRNVITASAIDGSLYFVTSDSLWTYNRAGGVKQIIDPANPKHPSFMSRPVKFQGEITFSGHTARRGVQLWKYTGSEVFPVGNIGSWDTDSTPRNFAVLDDTLYFSSELSGGAKENLWKFDGVNEPQQAAERPPCSNCNRARDYTSFQGSLYYWDDDDDSSYELWRYTGNYTPEKIDPPVYQADYYSPGLTEYHGALYFSGGSYDGSSFVPTPMESAREFFVFQDMLYFSNYEQANGAELWRFDGKTASLVADINPGSNGSYPGGFAEFRGELYFQAYDQAHGRELWKYDGVAASLVEDIFPGPDDSTPDVHFSLQNTYDLTEYHDALYFSAHARSEDDELFRYDGATVTQVTNSFAPRLYPTALTAFDDALFFATFDADGNEMLWRYDEQSLSEQMLLAPNAEYRYFGEPIVFQDELYLYADDGIHGRELWKLTVDQPTKVVGRQLFYNHSVFDANDPFPSDNDELALATDKAALLPGEHAGFLNYSSYTRGINGLVIDIGGLAALMVRPSDFEFRMGNDDNPHQWVIAPQPLSIDVERAGGKNGSTRVKMIWADDALTNCWLQVTVKNDGAIPLAAPDVFYFGNTIGDTGNSSADAVVNASDEIGARNHPHTFINVAAVDSPYDFNRDGLVNAADQIIARSNATAIGGGLKLISVPAAPIGMPGFGTDSADHALAAAVAIALEVERFGPETNLVMPPTPQRESEGGPPELQSSLDELDGRYFGAIEPAEYLSDDLTVEASDGDDFDSLLDLLCLPAVVS